MRPDRTGNAKPPILFLHGVFGRPALLEPGTRFFEAAGFECHTPVLPGRDPTDDDVLARTGIQDCFRVALAAYDRLAGTPIVVGHSMGGLLCLCCCGSCRAGRSSPRNAPFVRCRSTPLSTVEQEELLPLLVRDSGRVFREMSSGASSTRVAAAVTCPVLCVSAGADRNVAQWISQRIAARYGVRHQLNVGLPHWIIVPSLVEQVAPPVLR